MTSAEEETSRKVRSKRSTCHGTNPYPCSNSLFELYRNIGTVNFEFTNGKEVMFDPICKENGINEATVFGKLAAFRSMAHPISLLLLMDYTSRQGGHSD